MALIEDPEMTDKNSAADRGDARRCLRGLRGRRSFNTKGTETLRALSVKGFNAPRTQRRVSSDRSEKGSRLEKVPCDPDKFLK